jgi:hypothetical protein
MIYNLKYSNLSNREEILNYLKEKQFKRVLDIGATMAGWSSEYLSHYMDINVWTDAKAKGFLGNICSIKTWDQVLEDVEKNGKFDFVICSHTLEDISSPLMVTEMINKIGLEGFIAVPSKNMELTRYVNGPYLGWVHHRWIYNIQGNEFVAYPKLNFIESYDWSDITSSFSNDINEICFFWKDNFEIKFTNDDYMGPNVESVYNYFAGLLG